jgi:hypothetical protein
MIELVLILVGGLALVGLAVMTAMFVLGVVLGLLDVLLRLALMPFARRRP